MNEKFGSWRSLIILACITIAGLALRVYQLGFQCFWTEEQYTAGIAAEPFSRILAISLLTDHNPPLYYLAAHASRILFGAPDVVLRYPSVFFGVLVIPVVYLVGREFRDELTGLFGAGFIAVLYPFMYYSQFARAYSMEIFFFACLLWVFIRIRKGVEERAEYVSFGILGGIVIWIHLFAVVPVLLMLADLLLVNGKRQGLVAAGSLALVTSPLLVMVGGLVGRRLFTSPSGASLMYGLDPWTMILSTPFEFFSWNYLLVVVFLGLIILGLKQRNKLTNEMFSISIITIALGIICSLFTPFYPRYYLIVAVPLVLIGSSGISWLIGKHIRNEWARIAVFGAIMGFWLLLQLSQYISHFTQQMYAC